MNDSSAKLKSLHVELEKSKKELITAKANLQESKEKVKQSQQLVSAIESSISATHAEIKKLEKTEIKCNKLLVTEHAILRFIERVYNINIEDVKSKILVDSVLKNHKSFGAGKFPHPNGQVVVRDNTVVTFED